MVPQASLPVSTSVLRASRQASSCWHDTFEVERGHSGFASNNQPSSPLLKEQGLSTEFTLLGAEGTSLPSKQKVVYASFFLFLFFLIVWLRNNFLHEAGEGPAPIVVVDLPYTGSSQPLNLSSWLSVRCSCSPLMLPRGKARQPSSR